ncbi:MAG: hypothetical protein U0527_07250 [Candidatus Eisenbacteria bacterium]
MAIFLITLKSDRDTRHCLVEHAANESQTRLDAAVASFGTTTRRGPSP